MPRIQISRCTCSERRACAHGGRGRAGDRAAEHGGRRYSNTAVVEQSRSGQRARIERRGRAPPHGGQDLLFEGTEEGHHLAEDALDWVAIVVEEWPALLLVPRQHVLHEQTHQPIKRQRGGSREAAKKIVAELTARRATAAILLRERHNFEAATVVLVQSDEPRGLAELVAERVGLLPGLQRALVRVRHP